MKNAKYTYWFVNVIIFLKHLKVACESPVEIDVTNLPYNYMGLNRQCITIYGHSVTWDVAMSTRFLPEHYSTVISNDDMYLLKCIFISVHTLYKGHIMRHQSSSMHIQSSNLAELAEELKFSSHSLLWVVVRSDAIEWGAIKLLTVCS